MALLALVISVPLVTNAFGQEAPRTRAAAPPAASATPVDRARAAASRNAFAAQTAAEALATARKGHADVFRKPAGRLLDGRVIRRLGGGGALVELDGRRLVASSNLPLIADGKPVDLELVRDGDGFSSRNSAVDANVSGTLAEGVAFDDVDARVVPLGGAAAVAPKLVDGRLFWANALADTDVAVVPTAGGVESFVQLRSAASPEVLSMPVELPDGARLVERRDAFYAVKDGQVQLRISRPVAVDAAGRALALETRVAGEAVEIVARHRGQMDVTYPVIVDPVIDARMSSSALMRWVYEGSPQENWAGSTYDGGFPSLWIYGWPQGLADEWAEWVAWVPGDSYVYRLESTGALTGGEDFTNPCVEIGLYRWSTGDLVTGESACGHAASIDPFVREPTEREPGPYFIRFRLSHPDYVPPPISAYTDGVVFYYSDDVAPISDGVVAPTGWTNWGLTIRGRDSGVGVKSLAASSPDSSWTASRTIACDGSQSFCPPITEMTASLAGLPEGEVHVTSTATDLVGRQSAPKTSVVKIDRSGPVLDVSWPEAEEEGAFVGAPSTLSVNATDGSDADRLSRRSGVASVELLVDGVPVDATMPGTQRVTQPCPAGSCPLATELDFDPADLSLGSHGVTVRARDHVGNERIFDYIVQVDTADPQLTLSGGLADAEGTTLEPGDYDLTIEATDDSGIEEVEVLVDGEPWEEAAPPEEPEGFARSSTTNTSFSYEYTHRGDAFTPGDHEIEIRVKDASGRWTSHKFPVKGNDKLSDTAGAIGFEEHFDYRSLATGAGSIASVNVASGNLTWHHRPIADAGRGLSTNVDITYNSRASDDDLGGGYDHIGEGFSLAISSLTRVNEPLDVRYVDKDHDKRNDVVTLTDADGTMHRFKRRMNGSTATDIFDPPPGVNLYLRKFFKNPTTTAQKRKVWAATQADGTTHFFDACGYQRSVEDRNGNALTYEYEDEVCKHHSRSQRAKLESVTDAAGRSVRLFYGWWGSSTKRIDYILDHAGRKLDFRYTHSKRLEKITEAYGTSQQRSFEFDYEDWGHKDKDLSKITDPLGRHTRIEYSDDHHGDHWHWPKYGLGERVVGLTDRRGNEMTFDYDVEHPFLETELRDRRGKLWRYRTDNQARLRELVDPLGTLTRYTWDADNNIAQLDEAVGTADQATSLFTWNANGELLTFTDPEGSRTELTYRNHNGVHEAPSGSDAAGTFVSDLETLTTPKGVASATAGDFVTRMRYELAGDPAGTADRGNLRSLTDAEDYVTTLDYNANGLLTREAAETTRGNFAVTTFESFDPNGRPQLMTDARGNATAAAGDGQWHLRYDVTGLLTRVTDPRGDAPAVPPSPTQPFTTQYTFDALDRLVTTRIPKLTGGGAGRFIDRSVSYDLNDNVRTATDGQGAVTTRTYNPMDDLETESSPAVRHDLDSAVAEPEVTRLSYDGEQNLEKIDSPRGTRTATVDDFTTTNEYDAAGRQIVARRKSRGSVVDEIVTSFAYDRRDNIVGVADPIANGGGGDPAFNATQDATRRNTYVYDRADRRIRSIDHLHDAADTKLTTVLGYDRNDNLIAATDPRGIGHTTTFEYDERDTMTAQVDPKGGRTAYERRGDGQTVRITKPNGTATPDLAGDFETRFTYDPMGDLLERTIPWAVQPHPNDDPWKIVYERDEVGDPVTIRDGRGRSFTNAFFDTGDLRRTSRPSHWGFDGAGIIERGPEAGPAGDVLDEETTQPGQSAAGDFGDVRKRPLPGVVPRAGDTEFEYDNEMRLTASVDAAGNRFEVSRDALGRIAQTSQPFDASEPPIVHRFAFDHNGNMRQSSNGDGHRTETFFDQFDRPERRREPGATAGAFEDTVFAYDRNDNLLSVQSPRGAAFTWRMAYDRLDRLTSRTNPRGDRTTFENFDAAGNPQSVVTPRGNVSGLTAAERAQFTTTSAFDALNRVTLVTDGLGNQATFAYDGDSNLIETVQPGSAAEPGDPERPVITRMSYDGRDMPYATTTGTGSNERSTITEFDPNGNLRREIMPRGVTRENGRVVPRWQDTGTPRAAGSNTSKHAVVFDYDADDLLSATHQAWGDPIAQDEWQGQNGRRYIQELERDQRGRITRITPSYDPDDAQETAQIGRRRTRYTHFQNGWIKTAIDPDYEGDGDDTVKRLRYDYNRRGHQISWRFERQEGTAEPVLTREVTRAFAPNGTLTTREARRPGRSPRIYGYAYNANHSLVSISDGDVGGDDHGNTRVTDMKVNAAEQTVLVDETWSGGRDTTFLYDPDGRVVRRQTDGQAGAPADPNDVERPYTYGGAGARTTAFAFDPLGREQWTAVCDGAGACSPSEPGARVTRSEYYPSSLPKQVTKEHNGVRETRFYLDDGRISRMRRVANSETQKDQAYAYDLDGNRTRDERGTYLHNARGALIRWERNSGTHISYDLLGSRSIRHANDSAGPDVTYEYSGDRLESMTSTLGQLSASTEFEYNALDSVRFIRHAEGTTEYVYDEFERLRTSKGYGVPAAEDGDRYCYDALDRRSVRIESNNTSTTCANAQAGGAGVRDYAYVGLTDMLAREQRPGGAVRTYDYDSAFTRLGRTRSGQGYRSYGHDANGTVEGIERADGTLPQNERYAYDPYGRLEPSVRTPNDAPNKAEGELATDDLKDNPFRFQGFYYDVGTQTYDMFARDYRPDIARFLSQDRFADAYGDLGLVADPTSQNRYAFAGGDPVSNIEIDGHQDFHAIDTGQRGCMTCALKPGQKSRAAQAVRDLGASHTKQAKEAKQEERQKERVTVENIRQSIESGDEKRLAANIAELLAAKQDDLNAKAAWKARQVAEAEANLPEGVTWEDYAKLVFDWEDPADYILTAVSVFGIGAGAKAAKVAYKANKLRKRVAAAGKAIKAFDKLSSASSTATRRAADNFRATTRLRQCAANSFVAGTPVLMADGTTKPIEAVRVGDRVMAADPATGATQARRVTALIRSDGFKRMAVVWAGGEQLTVTDEHPFYVAGRGWVRASELRRGDLLVTADGELVAVEAVLDADRRAMVYNLTVAGLHTYFAGGQLVLVHNTKDECELADDLLQQARTKRDDLADEVGSSKATVTGGYDPATGRVVAGCNKNPFGCAEDDVARQLGIPNDQIRFTEAMRPRTGEQVPVCLRCQTKYDKSQFPPGTKFQRPEP